MVWWEIRVMVEEFVGVGNRRLSLERETRGWG